jgi:glycosyltransferase involved in cell wall biosynthesis
MNILHLSTYDLGGGAAIAAYRLHKGLLRLQQGEVHSEVHSEVRSTMLVGTKTSDDYTVIAPEAPAAKLWQRIVAQLDQAPRMAFKSASPLLISPAWVPSGAVRSALAHQPDIVNLHWIGNGFINIGSLRALAHVPVVWTLHDMWAFCGAEHYTGGDTRYKTGYQKKIRPEGETGFDVHRWTWKRKMKSIAALKYLTVVADSYWLAQCARESLMFQGRRVETIHYGLDTERFRPIPKAMARQILGVPDNKMLILFGAINAAHDKRKGIDLLAQALHHLHTMLSAESLSAELKGSLKADDVECLIFGASEPRTPPRLNFPTRYLGPLHDELSLAVVYAAADVMIVPSREEAFGQTALEALACGTPAVAFRVGGLPDSIDHCVNGYLAVPFDTEDLARGILWILADKERAAALAVNARNKVLSGFTLEHQAKKYIEIYREMLKEV